MSPGKREDFCKSFRFAFKLGDNAKLAPAITSRKHQAWIQVKMPDDDKKRANNNQGRRKTPSQHFQVRLDKQLAATAASLHGVEQRHNGKTLRSKPSSPNSSTNA